MNDTIHGISGTHRNVLLFQYNVHVLMTKDNTRHETIH